MPQLSPSAGTDYPYIDIPGAVRTYGQRMGSELHVNSDEPLRIEAKVRINPDIDRLDRLELIEQGQVIKSVFSHKSETQLELYHSLRATHGTWLVVRAFGMQN